VKLSRTNKILEKMKQQGINQALISDPYSIFYLTEYLEHPGERFFAVLLDENGDHKLFINALFPLENDLGLEKVVYSDTVLPLMNHLPENKFVDVSQIVDRVRMIKDEEEKELMRRASILNDAACQRVINSISEGKSEKDVAKDLLDIHEDLGVDGLSFDPIIAYGANGANPHGTVGDRYVKPGDAIIIDMGGIKDNYCSDMTRTVFWKQPSEKAREVFEIVLEAQKRGVAAVKPGVRFCDIDAACRDYITEKGYGEFFTHRTGHHIGLECHEYGDISSINETKCEPGMIFSIEPGIYLPGEFGVRIEDLVLVTEDGCEVLNKLNKELVIIGE